MMIIENPETDKYIRYLLNRLRTYDTVVNRNTDAINRIYELHKPNNDNMCEHCSQTTCWGCGEWGCSLDCGCDCHVKYPCPTIKALDGEPDD